MKTKITTYLCIPVIRMVVLTLLLLPFSLYSQCPSNLTVTNGNTGTWVNSTTGVATVRITAIGAGGGKNTVVSLPGDGQVNTLFGGSGANISGTFTIPAGATVLLIAGAAGNNSQNAGSGGGGSGVVYCGNPSNCGTGTILIIAGGGGGTSGFVAGNGGSASLSGAGNGGTNAGQNACGGGGINEAGQSGLNGATGGGQVSKTGLSLGGVAGNNNGFPGAAGGNGMGGGGASDGGAFAAGGGGHTGGNAENFTITAQGGLSINTGTSQSNVSGVNGGGANAGSVTIECLGILPVKLTSFYADIMDNNSVKLSWQTASEVNNRGFQIERMSVNNPNWEVIGFVNGNNTSTLNHTYDFIDRSPLKDINYYRLNQIDFDGKQEYSHLVSADLMSQKESGATKIFPNPVFSGVLQIQIAEEQNVNKVAEIFNLMGQKVTSKSLVGGINQILVNELSKGLYILRISNGQSYELTKLLIE
ncbi:MAG TPA: T9SS type A sorting domain-containing protein [Saprospiraceae bacterium]|nr:T9SS type A sorting domain-containing protein [Saprospiraceae bacterium]